MAHPSGTSEQPIAKRRSDCIALMQDEHPALGMAGHDGHGDELVWGPNDVGEDRAAFALE
jgi:hypothetical protein